MTKINNGIAIDRNARAFGEDSVETQRIQSSETVTADASQAESEENEGQSASGTEPVVEEQKVPYSRMKSAIERARAWETKAIEAEERAARIERESRNRPTSNEPYAEAIKSRIIKLYGDNDVSKEIIEIELNRAKEIEEIAERKANEAFDRRSSSQKSEIEANERALEDNIEDFSMSLGRDLTPDEEDRLLEIADKYSPVGADGKYLSGEPLPLDRAWEIYEMEQSSKGQASKKSRSQATALTSSRSEGETTTEAQSGEWYPGRWRDRLNGITK